MTERLHTRQVEPGTYRVMAAMQRLIEESHLRSGRTSLRPTERSADLPHAAWGEVRCPLSA
jgi:hypothetical protein